MKERHKRGRWGLLFLSLVLVCGFWGVTGERAGGEDATARLWRELVQQAGGRTRLLWENAFLLDGDPGQSACFVGEVPLEQLERVLAAGGWRPTKHLTHGEWQAREYRPVRGAVGICTLEWGRLAGQAYLYLRLLRDDQVIRAHNQQALIKLLDGPLPQRSVVCRGETGIVFLVLAETGGDWQETLRQYEGGWRARGWRPVIQTEEEPWVAWTCRQTRLLCPRLTKKEGSFLLMGISDEKGGKGFVGL